MLSILGFPWFPTWRGGGTRVWVWKCFWGFEICLLSQPHLWWTLWHLSVPFLAMGGRRWIPKPFSHSDLCICFEIVNISFKYICWNAPVLLRVFLNLLSFATINKPFNGCSSTFSIMKTWQVFFCRRGSLCNFSSNVIVTWLSIPSGGSGGKTSRKGVKYYKVGETFGGMNAFYGKQVSLSTYTIWIKILDNHRWEHLEWIDLSLWTCKPNQEETFTFR